MLQPTARFSIMLFSSKFLPLTNNSLQHYSIDMRWTEVLHYCSYAHEIL